MSNENKSKCICPKIWLECRHKDLKQEIIEQLAKDLFASICITTEHGSHIFFGPHLEDCPCK